MHSRMTRSTKNFSNRPEGHRLRAVHSPTKPGDRIEHRLGVPFLLQHFRMHRSGYEVVVRQPHPASLADLAFFRPRLLPNRRARRRFRQIIGEDLAEEPGAVVRVPEERIGREGVEERGRDRDRVQRDGGRIRRHSLQPLVRRQAFVRSLAQGHGENGPNFRGQVGCEFGQRVV